MHLEYVANGMGSQSMYLMYLASQKRIPATVSITADTGWENDCDLYDGTKTTAREFYDRHIERLGEEWKIPTYFVRAVDRKKVPIVSIPERMRQIGKPTNIPVYGSRGGQQNQACTQKWKLAAMDQQCRRLGATHARAAQGILYSERARRVKGVWIGNINGFDTYQTTVTRKKVTKTIKWRSHYYPLVDMRMNREDVRAECDRLGIPYLLSSECEGCPHADVERWLRRAPETIEKLANLESTWEGEYFFTKECRPLKEVIEDFKRIGAGQGELFAGGDCTDGVCFT